VFYNPDNNRVVVDLVDKDGTGGNEVFRQILDEKKLLGHTQRYVCPGCGYSSIIESRTASHIKKMHPENAILLSYLK
jgi:hypothetical protein